MCTELIVAAKYRLTFLLHTCTAPTGAPFPSLETNSSTHLHLTWHWVNIFTVNGVVRNYSIQVCEMSPVQMKCWVTTVGGNQTSTTLILHSSYNYTLSIAASTVEIGPFSTPLQIQMPEDGKTCNHYSGTSE